MGKRVNYACRSVISPDPYIQVNEIGVPPVFAKRLTYAETVTDWNVEYLAKLVENGADVLPGATHVEDERGQLVSLAHLHPDRRRALARTLLSTPSAAALAANQRATGVHVKDGEGKKGAGEGAAEGRGCMCGARCRRKHAMVKSVYWQVRARHKALVWHCGGVPTLHRPGIMAHRVKILKGEKTLRLHYANCNVYNADFDGDEMNVHLPQDALGRAEAYSIVDADTVHTAHQRAACERAYSARYWGKSRQEDATLRVRGGEVVTGVFDKAQFARFGLVHCFQELYGCPAAGKLLSSLSRLLTTFLQIRGFTCGVGDLLLTAPAEAERAAIISRADSIGDPVLVDTTVKTSRSGYLQRCLVKNLEGLRVHYDYSVRDSDASIVQFRYGEDAIDTSRTSFLTNFEFIKENEQQVAAALRLDEAKALGLEAMPPRATAAADSTDPAETAAETETATGAEAAAEVMDVECPGSKLGVVSPAFEAASEKFLQSAVLGKVGKGAGKKGKKKDAERLREVLEMKYLASTVQPGEPVGVLAAQSVGEPSTQMTLNTFHFAGRGEANVTLGIPRLREILMTAARNISTPVMDCPLLPGRTLEDAQRIANKLRRITMAELISAIHVSERTNLVPINGGDRNSRRYSIRLAFHPTSRYPADLDLKFEEIKAAFSYEFAPRVGKALERALDRAGGGDTWMQMELSVPVTSPAVLIHEIVDKVAAAVVVRATPGVQRCAALEPASPGQPPRIQVEGLNFPGLWNLAVTTMGKHDDEGVLDLNRLSTNHIAAVLTTLGVEAARATIVKEVRGVFGMYGIAVDPRHLGLIADFMTYDGGYRACNRNGIDANPSPILKMSFETATKFLINAASKGQTDRMESPSSRIALGRVVDVGSGCFDLMHNL
ncbi:unnamed protein product [Closterium sp. Yama58-4]|nr:unnamed protein product [Closterium sp. Yama58-4]